MDSKRVIWLISQNQNGGKLITRTNELPWPVFLSWAKDLNLFPSLCESLYKRTIRGEKLRSNFVYFSCSTIHFICIRLNISKIVILNSCRLLVTFSEVKISSHLCKWMFSRNAIKQLGTYQEKFKKVSTSPKKVMKFVISNIFRL